MIPSRPTRAMLYVPGSSDKMIRKSHSIEVDTLIFDLEDSVANHRKGAARESVYHGLRSASSSKGPQRAVRINPPSSDENLASDDLELLLPLGQLEGLVIPKVEHEADVAFVLSRAQQLRPPGSPPLSLTLCVESAASLLRMPSILETLSSTSHRPSSSLAHISSLLFGSEDFCHSAGIIRTRSRRELLMPRQQMALIAKAYGMAAIDMVCIDYKDEEYLIEECRDGAEIGFDGKQAIHPAQVATIQKAFAPSEQEVADAEKIKRAYEEGVKGHKGAVEVELSGRSVMVDAPMLKVRAEDAANVATRGFVY
ncbi:beta subunit of citrate lyase [Jaminaea rosea]|uniref:Beta subunit of citrate lyase n=1 Tax=Jaminaea rosea TaxID=1569628 RepID=A0A316UUV1_9BASI|nr:beta subunit of citrate lyase [Jaminaea rosea]PWN29059.1 beta subunit of citrate lyase [Jaminaea rosea]